MKNTPTAPYGLTLEFFKKLANYLNIILKGAYVPEEIKENAEVYYSDYKFCIKNKRLTETIAFLVKNLTEDGTTESLMYASQIMDSIVKTITSK